MNARRIPPGAATAMLRAALPIARTWRFRHPDDPGTPYRPRLAPEVHACWHEHILPLAWLFAGQELATLASRDRDGEIVARLLGRMGYAVARGSSTRGGRAGYRQLARALEAGRGVIIAGDGPRGPRRALKGGAARLAAHAGGGVTAVAAAASAGWRLRSWDRFVIPAPGATVFVSLGRVPSGEDVGTADIETALRRQVARCEQAAWEAARSRPPRTARRALEGRLRASWRRRRPPPALRPAALAFGLVHDARHRLYDIGVLATRDAGIPVISVGGVTVGGSGKTPLTAHFARLLGDAGHRPAILARGYADELALLAAEAPDARVWGHPDRVRAARRAASEGATVAVLDDGFQHRPLARDLDILLVDRDALRRTNGARLPAGPFREQWSWAASRAQAVICTGREPWTAEAARFDDDLRRQLAGLAPGASIASLVFGTEPPEPANAAARAWSGAPAPRLALTGIMKPNLFFAQADAACASVRCHVPLGDHRAPRPGDRTALTTAAGEGGVLTTRKDLHRLRWCFDPGLPLWVLPETLEWKAGWPEVRRAILDAAANGGSDDRRDGG